MLAVGTRWGGLASERAARTGDEQAAARRSRIRVRRSLREEGESERIRNGDFFFFFVITDRARATAKKARGPGPGPGPARNVRRSRRFIGRATCSITVLFTQLVLIGSYSCCSFSFSRFSFQLPPRCISSLVLSSRACCLPITISVRLLNHTTSVLYIEVVRFMLPFNNWYNTLLTPEPKKIRYYTTNM